MTGNRIATRVTTKESINTKTESGNCFCIRNFRNLWLWQPCFREYNVVKFYKRYYMLGFPKMKIVPQMILTVMVIQKKGRVMQDKSCCYYRVKLIVIGNMFYSWLATTWKTQKLVPSKKISEQQHFLFLSLCHAEYWYTTT